MGFNIKNNYGPNIEVNEGGVVNLQQSKDGLWHTVEAEEADYEEIKEESVPAAKKQSEEPKVQPVAQETFVDRTKAIMRKMATKNGQRIESKARGYAGAYIYNIDAEAFCAAMDDMVSTYGEKLVEFLGGTIYCVQVTKVCFFIGQVISRQIINDSQLQLADVFFAFEDYYTLSTVQAKLSIRSCTDEESVLLGTFEGLLRKHKS